MSTKDDEPRRRQVFTGDSRLIFCRDVSEFDCNRVMADDADNCGIETHSRVVPVGQLFGEAKFRSRSSLYRRKIIVDEDYEILFDEDSEAIELDRATFKPNELWVATKVQNEFTSYHSCSADEAIENIRLLVERSLHEGKYRALGWGGHLFWWRGYQVIVTPNLRTVVRYRTNHYERTPQQVVDGVKSRLSKRRTSKKDKAPIPDSIISGEIINGVISRVSNLGVFVTLIDNVDGLIHRNNLGNDFDHRRTIYVAGADIQVEVIDVDRELNRVGLRLVEARPL